MTIPASAVVNITPGVLSPGGTGLVMSGLVLTQNLLMPTGTVLSFANAMEVSDFFGPASLEYAYAQIYFAGMNNATQQPAAILFASYNAAARAGWIQGGSLAGLTLTELQAFSGTLTVTIAGSPLTSSSISLSGASSFSNAATVITAGFSSPAFSVAWDAVQSCFIFTSTATGATETVTFISGTLAADLNLTQATGATLSQGAAIDTPSSAMNNVVAMNQNWATMSYLTEPTLANKEAFAAWFSSQNDQYLGVIWDSDTQASVANATEPFGVVAKASDYNGVMCIGGDPAEAAAQFTTLAALNLNIAAFVQGMIASINFSQTKGRITLAGKSASSAAVTPNCANLSTYTNLLANGYSCYGVFASRNQGFVFFSNGNMPGTFPWVDQYIDEIWLTAALQATLLTLYTTVNAIPYDPFGYGLISSALIGAPAESGTEAPGPINAALNAGVIVTGVELSGTQVAALQGAGLSNAAISLIGSQGYYLQILDPGAAARNARQTPVINLWYTDGGAIQSVNLASIDIL